MLLEPSFYDQQQQHQQQLLTQLKPQPAQLQQMQPSNGYGPELGFGFSPAPPQAQVRAFLILQYFSPTVNQPGRYFRR